MKKSNIVIIVLLVLILVAVLGVGGCIISKLNNKIENQSKDINKLRNEIHNAGTSYENSLNENTNISDNNSENVTPGNNTSEALTGIEAKTLGQEMYKYAYEVYWKSAFDVKSLADDTVEMITVNGNKYSIITNYDEVVKGKFSENCEKELCKYVNIIYENNQYLMLNADRGSNRYYIDTEIEVAENTSDMIKFNAVSSYANENLEELPDDMSTLTDTEQKVEEFILVKENGAWKIDKFTCPN